MTEAERNRKIEGEKLAQDMASICNDYSVNHDHFINKMVNSTHRTIQQTMAELMYKTIAKMAELSENGNYDLRNKESYKTAEMIHEFMKKESPLGDRWWKMPCI